MTATGSCNCEGVHFEIRTQPDYIYVCHCSICRAWTGNNGVAVVVIPTADFKWIKGEDLIRTWRKPGYDWLSSFCTVCGSALPGPNGPDTMFIPAGLIKSGGDLLKIGDHIFVDSRASWDVIGDDGCQHPGAYGANIAE